MRHASDSAPGMRKAWRILASLSLVLAAGAMFVAVLLFTRLDDIVTENARQKAVVTCQLIDTKGTQIETLLLLTRLLDNVEAGRSDLEDTTRAAFRAARAELRRERIVLRMGIRRLRSENGRC